MKQTNMKVGQVKVWLNQGPAMLISKCEPDLMASVGTRWVVYLLATDNMISVPENTLHNGDR
tara:strand:- start:1800 stop:1985 length:186 start_codon:yes stop_codon:yes gene_type:complete